MKPTCFLLGPTKKFSLPNWEKTRKGKLIKWASKNILGIHLQVSNVVAFSSSSSFFNFFSLWFFLYVTNVCWLPLPFILFYFIYLFFSALLLSEHVGFFFFFFFLFLFSGRVGFFFFFFFSFFFFFLCSYVYFLINFGWFLFFFFFFYKKVLG